MKNPALIGVTWVATVALAWFVGTSMKEEGSHRHGRTETAGGRKDAPPKEPTDNTLGSDGKAEPRKKKRIRTKAMNSGAAAEPEEPYTLEGVGTIDELSRRVMKFAEFQLARGPEGHRTLFREFDRITQDKSLRPLFRDERQMVRLAYPWVKWAVAHEQELAALMETIYKTAAKNPAWFEGLDDDSLEALAEGLAVVLPSVADAETMDRFRGYVKEILAHPEGTLPRAVEKNRRDLQRNLEWWAPELSGEEALRRINDPSVGSAERLALLSRMDPRDMTGLDLVAILEPAIQSGNSRIYSSMARLPLSSTDIARLDQTFIEAIAKGKVRQYSVRSYLFGTKRQRWADARSFVEDGLRRGDKATQAFAYVLLWGLSDRPDAAYVKTILDTYGDKLDENTVTQLKTRYKIQ